jgi:hypothetical protein
MWKIPTIKRKKEEIRTIVQSGINITLILLVLNLLSFNLAILEQTYTLTLSIYILIGFLLLNSPIKKIILTIKQKSPSQKKIITGLLLLIFSFVILFFTSHQIIWIASIAILLSGLDLTLKSLNQQRQELSLLTMFTFIYTLFILLVSTIPIIWTIIQQLSLIISSNTGTLIDNPLLLGPSTSGLWILITFALFLKTSIFIQKKIKPRHLLRPTLVLISLFIIWIIYIIILGTITFETKNDTINLHILFFIFCLIPTYLYLSKTPTKPLPSLHPIKKITTRKLIKNGKIWALVFLLLSTLILTVFINTNTTAEKKKILFYGQHMLGTWAVPEYGKYGR